MRFTQDGGVDVRPPPPPPPSPAPAGDACISSRSCEELQAMFGGAFPYATGQTRVCAESDNGLGADGATQCTKEAPFQQAQAVCYEAGSRLCTVAEVLGGSTTNTGCNLNSELIWTSSPCASGAGGKASAYGCDPATTRCIRLRSGGDEVCQTDLSVMLGVRCCADGEASRQGKSMCDMYAAEENECTSAMSCAELSARDGRNKWPIGALPLSASDLSRRTQAEFAMLVRQTELAITPKSAELCWSAGRQESLPQTAGRMRTGPRAGPKKLGMRRAPCALALAPGCALSRSCRATRRVAPAAWLTAGSTGQATTSAALRVSMSLSSAV